MFRIAKYEDIEERSKLRVMQTKRRLERIISK